MILSETQAAERPADRLPGIGSTSGMTLAARARRTAGVVKWISIVLIMIALYQKDLQRRKTRMSSWVSNQ